MVDLESIMSIPKNDLQEAAKALSQNAYSSTGRMVVIKR